MKWSVRTRPEKNDMVSAFYAHNFSPVFCNIFDIIRDEGEYIYEKG